MEQMLSSSDKANLVSSWYAGAVIEYRAPPWNQWVPALILQTSIHDYTLTVEFMMMGVPHEHTVPSQSELLAPLGTHEQGLPPGFWSRPSKSRPGQLAYADKVTGARYGTAELAWKVHLERMLQMEGLPTFCDLTLKEELPSKEDQRFPWPSSMDLEVVKARPVHESGVCGAAGQGQPDGYRFSNDVHAELMAAPSPAAVPLAAFARYHDVENESPKNTEMSGQLEEQKCKQSKLFCCSAIPDATDIVPSSPKSGKKHCSAADIPTPILKSAASERVAELEGALEESRDRVKKLEASLEKSAQSGTKSFHTESCGKSTPPYGASQHCIQSESAQTALAEPAMSWETLSQSQACGTESAYSEACSAKVSFDKVEELLSRIVAEETLLKKAVEVAELRRSLGNSMDSCEAPGDESRFADLEKEIQEREAKLFEISKVHEKKEQDLEELRLSLQRREHVNASFADHLRDWEAHLTQMVSSVHPRHSTPCVTPPKLPRAQTRESSELKRARSTSPQSSLARGLAGRAADAAVAEAVAAAGRAGPRRSSSVRGATPEQGSFLRSSRHSILLSGGRIASRGCSPCRSAAGGSVRSVCSTTAPSECRSDSSCVLMSERGHGNPQQARHYTGGFSHPSFGPEEILIDVTIDDNSCQGVWKAMDQVQDISVNRVGGSIVLADFARTTVLDGREVVGGMLVGTVIQNGERAGRFWLKPCLKSRVQTTLLKTCIQRHVQMPVAARWRAVGVPKIPLRSAKEITWRANCPMVVS
jgi:hypothetical protein